MTAFYFLIQGYLNEKLYVNNTAAMIRQQQEPNDEINEQINPNYTEK